MNREFAILFSMGLQWKKGISFELKEKILIKYFFN